MSEDFKYTDEFFKEFEQKYTRTPREPKPVKKKHKRSKSRYKVAYYAVVYLLAFLITFLSLKSCSKPADSGESGINDNPSASENTNSEAPEIVNPYFEPDSDTVALGSEVDSTYAILIEKDTGKIVAQKNYNNKMYPASLTKIMTLLVAVENVEDLNETFEMTYEIIDPLYVQEASLAGFSDSEQVKIIDLLYGAILPSGAEATYALAIHTAGSEADFVKLMNDKVAELGLKNTCFVNTSGLYDDNNYTTAYDMALILKAASENELAAKILSTYQYTTNPTEQHPEGILLTSTLFSRMKGDEPENGALIVGGKTGFVSQAGNCIASFGKSTSGKEYIFVTGDANGLWKSVFDHINTYEKYVN